MSKKVYIGGTDGTAKKVNKIYLGIDGVAKKVRKGYIGVGGVARPFLSGETKIEYYGNGAKLTTARRFLKGASTKNHALFAGGRNPTTSDTEFFDEVDAFDKDLVKSTITPLTIGRGPSVGVSFKGCALFIGGEAVFTNCFGIDAYDENLVKSNLTDIPNDTENSTTNRANVGAASNDTHVLVAGGGNGSKLSNMVNAYDSNFVMTTIESLSTKRTVCMGVSVTKKILFAGGTEYKILGLSPTDIVDAYDENLIKTEVAAMSVRRQYAGATGVDGYAILAGGQTNTSSSMTDVVDAYDSNLVLTSAASLARKKCGIVGVSTGNHVVFGGGEVDSSATDLTDVESYDTNLVHTIQTAMTQSRTVHGGARVGNSDYIMFAGGEYDSNKMRQTTEIYIEVTA